MLHYFYKYRGDAGLTLTLSLLGYMRKAILWLIFCALGVIPSVFESELKADTVQVELMDSIELSNRAKLRRFQHQSFHPFMENKDSAFYWLFSPHGIGLPRVKVNHSIDPMSPFSKELYIRQSSGKIWLFAASIAWLLLLLYFRNAMPKQFEMRIKSLFSSYNFSELLNEKLGFASAGTLLSQFLGWSVLSMAVITTWVYAQLLNLNNPAVFALILIAILIWELLIYTAALLFAEATGLHTTVRAAWQRKANASLWFGLIAFPIVLLAYYNAPKLHEYAFDYAFVYLILSYFILRLFWVFTGIIREGAISLASVLYFCGIECLPLALIANRLMFG